MASILTDDTWSEYLSDDAMTADRLRRRVDIAEWRVISHYREEAAVADSLMYFDEPLGAETSPGIVQLRDWAEADDGVPDVDAMPDDLVRRLRIVISDVVEWRLEYETREGVESISQGSRSKSYDTNLPSLPSRLFQPLDKYDEREPFTGF